MIAYSCKDPDPPSPNICETNSEIRSVYEEKCDILNSACFEECWKVINTQTAFDVSCKEIFKSLPQT